MPSAPSLPTTITANVTTNHPAHSQIVHGVVNGIYLVPIGATQTSAFTIAQANSGEFIPVNAAVAVTVPSLTAGTNVELWAQAAGKFTLAASGVTLQGAVGATLAPRVQYSSVSLLWVTSTLVLVAGDLA